MNEHNTLKILESNYDRSGIKPLDKKKQRNLNTNKIKQIRYLSACNVFMVKYVKGICGCKS